MSVAWLASPQLKDAAVAEVRGHRTAGTLSRQRDRPVQADADGRFQGGFHVCLTARRLAEDRGVPVARLLADGGGNVAWLDESERLWGIPRTVGALLDRCFEWLPAAEAADFAVAALQAIPVGADLDRVGAAWMLDVLADTHEGVLARLSADSPAHTAVAQVAALYRRLLADEAVDAGQWALAAADAETVGAQAQAANPDGVDGPAAATAHAAAAAHALDALPFAVRATAWRASVGLADEQAAAARRDAYAETEATAQAAEYAVNTLEALVDAEFNAVLDPIRQAAERGRAALGAGRVPDPADAAAAGQARQAAEAGVERRTEYHRWRATRLIRHLGEAPVGNSAADGSAAAPQPLRRARVFDGLREDGSPLIQRPGLTSVDEIMRIVGYLKAAPTILFGRGLDTDAWSPGDPPVVPRTFSTDGTWIWSGAVTYYLQKYGMPPESELLAHIRARDYTLPEVSAAARESASSQLTGRGVNAP